MKYIIDIPEDIRIAISQMGLLRIPDEMIRVVDEAIQHSMPLDKYKAETENIRVYTRDEVINMLKDIKYSDDVLKSLDNNIKILRFVQDKEQTDGNNN